MIFSSAMRLRISSASTVERRAREVSRRRSRSTSRATAEAASSMAVTALRRVSRSLSSMHGILPEAVPLIVALGDEAGAGERGLVYARYGAEGGQPVSLVHARDFT